MFSRTNAQIMLVANEGSDQLRPVCIYSSQDNKHSVCIIFFQCSKTCLKQPLKKTKNWFSIPIIAKCRSKVLQNAPGEYSAIRVHTGKYE